MAKSKNLFRRVTGVVRLSYAHVGQPKDWGEGEEPKYEATALYEPGSETDKIIQRLIEDIFNAHDRSELADVELGENCELIGKNVHDPIQDGNDHKNDEYKGMLYFKATSKSKPALWEDNGDPMLDPADMYSGAFVQFSITGQAWRNKKGKAGISLYLNAIKFIEDGDELSGASASHDEFEDDAPSTGGRGRTQQTRTVSRGRVQDEPQDEAPAGRRSRGGRAEAPAAGRGRSAAPAQGGGRQRRAAAPVDDYEDEPQDEAPAGRRSRGGQAPYNESRGSGRSRGGRQAAPADDYDDDDVPF